MFNVVIVKYKKVTVEIHAVVHELSLKNSTLIYLYISGLRCTFVFYTTKNSSFEHDAKIKG